MKKLWNVNSDTIWRWEWCDDSGINLDPPVQDGSSSEGLQHIWSIVWENYYISSTLCTENDIKDIFWIVWTEANVS